MYIYIHSTMYIYTPILFFYMCLYIYIIFVNVSIPLLYVYIYMYVYTTISIVLFLFYVSIVIQREWGRLTCIRGRRLQGWVVVKNILCIQSQQSECLLKFVETFSVDFEASSDGLDKIKFSCLISSISTCCVWLPSLYGEFIFWWSNVSSTLVANLGSHNSQKIPRVGGWIFPEIPPIFLAGFGNPCEGALTMVDAPWMKSSCSFCFRIPKKITRGKTEVRKTHWEKRDCMTGMR